MAEVKKKKERQKRRVDVGLIDNDILSYGSKPMTRASMITTKIEGSVCVHQTRLK